MRPYAQFVSTFWTRGSGKKLRGNPRAQILAVYLMTSPLATITGIYHVSITTICEQTGLTPDEVRAALALPALSEIARYDEEAELAWVPNLTAYQVSKELNPRDNRYRMILRQLELVGDHPFVKEFVRKYNVRQEAPSKPLASPSEGASEPLRSPLQAPRKGLQSPFEAPQTSPSEGASKPLVTDLVLDQDPDQEGGAGGNPSVPIAQRAKLWVKDPTRCSYEHPNPETWPEILALLAARDRVFGGTPELPPRTPFDPRVKACLDRYAEGLSQADLVRAIEGSKKARTIADNPEHQGLQTILRDGGQVAKFLRLAGPAPESGTKRVGPVLRTPKAQAERAAFFGNKTND